jgi:tryptophanyl-tRNA synthetase
MSKSYNNYIGLFEDPKTLKSKVMKIVTDSKSVDEPKDPTTCTVYKLYQLLATPDETAELASRYRVGGLGYGTAKQELLSVIERELAPLRERYEALRARPNYLHEVLGDGAAKHRKLATATIRMVRDAQGLGRYL